MKVSIQGEAGSFHDVAARQYFGNLLEEIIPCPTFERTLGCVRDGSADYALMAIENARTGSILQNYTLIRESSLRILGEHDLRVRQNLMALPGQTLLDIHEVRSHPIAISQCMTYLNTLEHVTLVETEDTAASARVIKEENIKGIAAIGSEEAARVYGLEVIASGIETYKKNYTRFLVVGNRAKGNKTGNKASLCFSLNHQPGSLAGVLVRFAELGINLTKIQSVPRLNGGWEYMFYIDLEIPPDTNMEMICNEMNEFTKDLEVLGIYKKCEKLYES
ncbi:MAG: prephenate dehydratase [Bacteroidales bacterium]